MKIKVIVPTNNVERINGFIKSFNSMENFSQYCKIIIIPNGNIDIDNIKQDHNVELFPYSDRFKNYENKIVPFMKLRTLPMILSTIDDIKRDFYTKEIIEDNRPDWYLLFDDDNRFPDDSDFFYSICIRLLKKAKDCSVVELSNKKNIGKINNKIDGFYWTGYGLFIKRLHIFDNHKEILNLLGACEDLLLSYLTLDKYGLPYTFYGNPTTRDKSKPNNWNQKNNPSYSKEILDNNIIGYIRERFNEPDWDFYGNIKNLSLPKELNKKIINRRINIKECEDYYEG